MDGWFGELIEMNFVYWFGVGRLFVCCSGVCVWGIGRYLSRKRRHEGVVRNTGGKFRMRISKRGKTMRSDQ